MDTIPFGSGNQNSQGADTIPFGSNTSAPVQSTQQKASDSWWSSLFGNPAQDIQQAGSQVNQAITGQGQYANDNGFKMSQIPDSVANIIPGGGLAKDIWTKIAGDPTIEASRGFQAAGTAAMAVPQVAADVIPGGKLTLGAISSLFGKGVETAGKMPTYLADAAQKVGLMTPEQRAQYDKNNADFAGSPLGYAFEQGAKIGQSSGDIANVILGAHGTANAVQNFMDNGIPKMKEAVDTAKQKAQAAYDATEKAAFDQKQGDLVTKASNEIAKMEDKYSNTRNANTYESDGGAASRERIAQSGVLKYAVDSDGVLRTRDTGGPVEQYRAMTVGPAESVVRDALAREGSKTSLGDIRTELTNQVQNSGMKGANLVNALAKIDKEIEGLSLEADKNGYVPNTSLQDAKIDMTNNTNYLTPPDVQTYNKAIARGYKTLIEDNSNFNVKEVNAELAKYYNDIDRLERLDGKRVAGGRLGKYTSQISGNIVGGAIGGLFGGPVGIAAGTIAGGETAAFLKGKAMEGTFNTPLEPQAPKSQILEKAVQEANSPRPMLPEGSGMRSQIPSGPTINLPARSVSTIDAQSNNLGNLNTRYSTQATPKTNVIPNATTPKTAVKPLSPGEKSSPTTASKPSTASNTSTGNALTERGDVSALKADTSGGFGGATKFYHGTTEGNAALIKEGGFKVGNTVNAKDFGDGVYVTPSLKGAQRYGGHTLETYVNPNIKIKTVDVPATLTREQGKELAARARKDGYDALRVNHPDLGESLVVFDPKNVSTKPFSPSPQSPLLQEALKYKTPEEFVKAQLPEDSYTTVYHRTNASPSQIEQSGFKTMENKNEIYVSNRKSGQAEGYGANIVPIRIKTSALDINDEFPSGETHYTIKIPQADAALKKMIELRGIWKQANKK